MTKNARLDADVYLISKVYDHRAVILAHSARKSGRCVGVDLFDDYFSDFDPRLTAHRGWLRAMSRQVSFALASTSAIADAVQPLIGAVPVHLLNDPAPSLDPATLMERLAAKRARAVAKQRLRIGWFGMGDNPYFDVGLHDLIAFAETLTTIERSGWDICLQILTNERALTADALARLARLPVRYDLDLWSEPRENALLAACDAAFLPVNAQPFSIVKSLNRGVTALTSGTQVLSAGYPLYEKLHPFVYREADTLIDDLIGDRARLRPDTLPALAVLLGDVADAEVEAERLARFLDGCKNVRSDQRLLAVLHGRRSDGSVHKMTQSQGALSVATPYSRSRLHYHIGVGYRAGVGHVVVQPQLEDRLHPSWRARFSTATSSDGTTMFEAELTAAELPPMPVAPESTKALKSDDLATYAAIMRASATLVETMLDVEVTISESEPGFAHLAHVE